MLANNKMSFENGLICFLKCQDGYDHLVVYMDSDGIPNRPGVTFYLDGKDLPTGYKGFHVHRTGNLQKGCQSLGPHYNPHENTHGDLNDPHAHSGDLGNVFVDPRGYCKTTVHSDILSLEELLGRSLVLHSKTDDLGLGSNHESELTGNSGDRVCCGVIGYA